MPRTRKHGGCITCRRRCRSCDKKRPACSQCANDGLVCGSYGDIEPQLAWVHATQETMRFNKGYPRPPSASGSAPPPSPCAMSSAAVSEEHAAPDLPEVISTQHDDVRLVVHDFLLRSASEQPFLNAFMVTAAPSPAQILSSQPDQLPLDGLMAAIDEFCHVEPSMRLAAEALSSGVVSAIGQSPQLWDRSLQAYNRAAAELVKALKARKRSPQSSAGVVATCRVLQAYELFFGQAGMWKAHLDAHMAFCRARGPGGFISGPIHQFFTNARILMIMSCLSKRTSSPLSTPEWRSASWQGTPKSPFDSVLNIIEDLTHTLGDLDHLRACRYAQDADYFRSVVLSSCQQVEARLQQLERLLEAAGINISMFDSTAAARLPIPPPRDAAELGVLRIASLYWAAQLLLHSTIKIAFRDATRAGTTTPSEPPRSATTAPDPSPALPPRPLGMDSSPPHQHEHLQPQHQHAPAEPSIYASKIAHTAAHLLLDPHSPDGPAGLFAIAMAAQFFASERGDPTCAEAQMLLDMLASSSMSALVGRFLSQLQGGVVPTAASTPVQKRDNLWLFVVLN